MNFSPPRSKANPASVTAKSACARAMRVASTLLQPCAMFANGPPCRNAGTPSMLCTRFGIKASRSNAMSAPVTRNSFAKTGSPSGVKPVTMRSSRARRSARFSLKQRIAMTSEAAVMSNPVLRSVGLPVLVRRWRSARSFMSMTRFQSTPSGFRRQFPLKSSLSMTAESRLFALVMAWKSPLKCRLIDCAGCTVLLPPPVAPPLRPKTGPIDGWRSARATFCPIFFKPCDRPMETVVLPSPAGVGVIAETRMSFPRGVLAFSASRLTLALSRPKETR